MCGSVRYVPAVALEPRKKKTQVAVYLTDEQLRRIDALVQRTGSTRNAVMREVVERGLPSVEKEHGLTSPP